MTDSTSARAQLRLIIIGFFLGLAVSIGALQLHQGAIDEAMRIHDRQADTLTRQLLAGARKIRADSIEKARLNRIADSASAVATAAIARGPRAVFVSRPDTTSPAPADTVRYALVMRAIDPAPFRIPQFMVDELASQERKLAIVARAWQAEQTARLYADSVVVPDLRRQLVDSDRLLKLERLRVEDRDRKIEAQGKRRRLERVAEGGVVLLILLVAR